MLCPLHTNTRLISMSEKSFHFTLDKHEMRENAKAALSEYSQEIRLRREYRKALTEAYQAFSAMSGEARVTTNLEAEPSDEAQIDHEKLLKLERESDSEKTRLKNYLMMNLKKLNDDHSNAQENAASFLEKYTNLFLNTDDASTKKSTFTQTKQLPNLESKKQAPMINLTWPKITDLDLDIDSILAESSLLFKEPVVSSTGGSKRPRVDPISLLKPLSRIRLNDEVIFVQYIRVFYIGYITLDDNTSSEIQSNAYLNLSAFDRAHKLMPNEFIASIVYVEATEKFYLSSYSNEELQIHRGDENIQIRAAPAEIETGDRLQFGSVELLFESC